MSTVVHVSPDRGPWADLLTAQHAAYDSHKIVCPGLWMDWTTSGSSGFAYCSTCGQSVPVVQPEEET